MISNDHSQFLLEIILKKVEVKEKFPITMKITLAIINQKTTIYSQHSSMIRNNTVSFHNQTIQMDLSQNIQIAVIAIKPKQQQLGRITLPIEDFKIHDLTNRKYAEKLSNRQIILHYEYNIINKHILQSQTQNEQLSEISIQQYIKRDPTFSRISETLNQTGKLDIESPEIKAKSQINMNNGIVNDRLQQSEEWLKKSQQIQNDSIIQFVKKINELTQKRKSQKKMTNEQKQMLEKIENNKKLIQKYKNEYLSEQMLFNKISKKSFFNILLFIAFIIGFIMGILL